MHKETFAFRMDKSKRQKLDKLAKFFDRDKSYIINQALDFYIGFQELQMEHIKAGLKDLDEGRFIEESEANRLFRKWLK